MRSIFKQIYSSFVERCELIDYISAVCGRGYEYEVYEEEHFVILYRTSMGGMEEFYLPKILAELPPSY